jgi:hypothetical protein
VISASDSDSELEEVDSESEDSELEELDSDEEELDFESDEPLSFFRTALATGFWSDAGSDVESSESESDSELSSIDGFSGGTLDLISGALASVML